MFKVRLKYAIADIDGTLYEVGTRGSLPHEAEDIFEKLPASSSRKATEAQKLQRRSFALAVAYLTAVKADPEVRAHYEVMAQEQGQTLRKTVMNDFMEGNDRFSR